MSLVSRIIFKNTSRKHVNQLFSSAYLFQNMAKMSSAAPAFEYLNVSTPKEYVFHVELNRPDKLNAMNYTLFGEIKKCFEYLSENEGCRVAILSAAGRFFTAGIDLQDITQNIIPKVAEGDDVARKAKLFSSYLRFYQQSMSSLELCKKPVITAVHSGCIGAGLNLITAADVRHCTKDAFFQLKEVDIGMAADIGALQRLPKIVASDSLARELSYTARKVPAAEALSLGLVSKVYDNKEEMIQGVLNLAEEISSKSPVAVQTTKASLVYSRDRTVEDGLTHISLLNQLMLQSEDLVNATMGQLTKDPNVKFSKL